MFPSSTKPGQDHPSWYRTQWTTLVNATPGASISALKKDLPGVYHWLMKHDKEWLMANRPPSRQWQKSINRESPSSKLALQKTFHEDPQTRDMQMASALRTCAQRIIDESGYPKRVTKRKILLAVPEIRRFERLEASLTASALQEVLETPETFALRRIRWFVQKCQQEQRHPTRRKFIQRINIDQNLHLPSVMHALNVAMDTLS